MSKTLNRVVLACLGIFCGLSVTTAAAQEIVVDRDVIYYDGPDFYAPRHILDVYRLEGSENRPVLIFIHGGGWTSGNKSLYGFFGNAFARYGFVTVIANYRLTDGSKGSVMHPGHIRDVARAVAWTFANIGDYGGSPEKIFISGHSAGGHLVSLLAVDPQRLAEHGLAPSEIAGVMSLSGVYDVRNPGFARIFGDDPAQRADASPISHVGDAQAPPFQILFAENNLPGLGPQAVEFDRALADLPSEEQIIEFPARTHGTIITRIAQPDDEVAAAMLDFMGAH